MKMKEYITPTIWALRPTAADVITVSGGDVFSAVDDDTVGNPQYKSLHDYFQ